MPWQYGGMKQNSIFETVLSAAVIAVAVGFLFFASTITSGARLSDYEITAQMTNASGVAAGASDVRLAGVKIGTVSSMTLDSKTYLAMVGLRIRHDIQVPVDSKLSVSSDTLSPNSYIQISPGRSADKVPAGGILLKPQ
jgi:phospholipid/cholesterol/gamma-HCH transport system substrate-binding protein